MATVYRAYVPPWLFLPCGRFTPALPPNQPNCVRQGPRNLRGPFQWCKEGPIGEMRVYGNTAAAECGRISGWKQKGDTQRKEEVPSTGFAICP
ncbi:hypothetical protein MGG_16256 [Pyricularia oryzae 70-15]|uniref:Uncharacterized protein n=3 Tax=Pyricularia oryzae TaxID=318829 RepID=G4MQ67_PYRO7|nr:uncharacterized protein MGG_16256 [Pyricularia oryzae 70-15]EHA57260.1 hypothetical protein MGG_16256 [Pyricularia oryzae 70-15]ELQ41339.1 hypothetical protein OOU_Y34scaffold00283g33 [Pyricularia oryzae Y34]